MVKNHWLVVWNMNFIFPNRNWMMIQSDEFIFFRGVETTNQTNINQPKWDS